MKRRMLRIKVNIFPSHCPTTSIVRVDWDILTNNYRFVLIDFVEKSALRIREFFKLISQDGLMFFHEEDILRAATDIWTSRIFDEKNSGDFHCGWIRSISERCWQCPSLDCLWFLCHVVFTLFTNRPDLVEMGSEWLSNECRLRENQCRSQWWSSQSILHYCSTNVCSIETRKRNHSIDRSGFHAVEKTYWST